MKKDKLYTLILILVFFAGLSLLLYPTLSDYWNSMHQSQMVSSYTKEMIQMDNDTYDHLWKEAREYNQELLDRENPFLLKEDQASRYPELMNISGNGVMGVVEIPSIGVKLPIYHGVAEEVLTVAIGHIEWSSLPTGGEGTHTVLSGHRGLPSARLFTDLDELEEGDLFMLSVLDETLTYEVDQILIVLPHETDALELEENKDLCTLVTCTPYGINSHRLLVRGHRVANQAQAKTIRVTADATQIDPLIMAPLVAAPMLLVLLLWLLIPVKKKR